MTEDEIKDIFHCCGIWNLLTDKSQLVSDIIQLEFSFEELLEDVQIRNGQVEKIFKANEESPELFYLLSKFLRQEEKQRTLEEIEEKLRTLDEIEEKLRTMEENQNWVCRLF